MKRFITADDVYEKKESKDPIYIDNNTIITAYAKDLIDEYGLEIKIFDKKDNQKCDCNNDSCIGLDTCKEELALSWEKIYQLLKEAVDKNILTEDDLLRMI